MEDLDDVKFAVVDPEGMYGPTVLALCGTREDADKIAVALSEDPEEPLEVAEVGENVYLDLSANISSQFSF